MFMYVFITWIVANVLHPIVASIYISFYAGEMNVGAGVAGMFFLIYGFIFSMPALLFGYLFLLLINKLPFSDLHKFSIWLFMATVSPTLNILLLSFVFLKSPYTLFSDPIWFDLIMPSTIAVFLTVLIRYNYFFKHIDQTSTTSQL